MSESCSSPPCHLPRTTTLGRVFSTNLFFKLALILVSCAVLANLLALLQREIDGRSDIPLTTPSLRQYIAEQSSILQLDSRASLTLAERSLQTGNHLVAKKYEANSITSAQEALSLQFFLRGVAAYEEDSLEASLSAAKQAMAHAPGRVEPIALKALIHRAAGDTYATGKFHAFLEEHASGMSERARYLLTLAATGKDDMAEYARSPDFDASFVPVTRWFQEQNRCLAAETQTNSWPSPTMRKQSNAP